MRKVELNWQPKNPHGILDGLDKIQMAIFKLESEGYNPSDIMISFPFVLQELMNEGNELNDAILKVITLGNRIQFTNHEFNIVVYTYKTIGLYNERKIVLEFDKK